MSPLVPVQTTVVVCRLNMMETNKAITTVECFPLEIIFFVCVAIPQLSRGELLMFLTGIIPPRASEKTRLFGTPNTFSRIYMQIIYYSAVLSTVKKKFGSDQT